MYMTPSQLQQAVSYVVAKHDPQNTGSLRAEMIQTYFSEMAHFGGHPLKCDTVYLAELIVEVLDNQLTFGADVLAKVYRFVENKHGIFETPITYSDFKEVHNPDGSTCTVSKVQTVEFHTGLSHPHQHSEMMASHNSLHVSAQPSSVYSHLSSAYPSTLSGHVYAEQMHPVTHSTVNIGKPQFVVQPTAHYNPTHLSSVPTTINYSGIPYELGANIAHSRTL